MILRFVMQHNLQRCISCSLFAGLFYLPLAYSGEQCLLCAFVLAYACMCTHARIHTLMFHFAAASYCITPGDVMEFIC